MHARLELRAGAGFLGVSHVIIGGTFISPRADGVFEDYTEPMRRAKFDTPRLSVLVVPEPAVSGLVAVAFAAFIRRRGRTA